MSLASGIRLGPYEIVSPLGAGGMGEVYRAQDTRLNRAVAIKVLPADVQADPERRQRFLREAEAVAGLNHPHICVLHDIGHERPGPDAPPLDFIVMELIEGESLAARLERGPLAVDQALRYAGEIADALDRAHRAGIVHRDLKPGNVMLTKTGAKLLDFGLAKLRLPPSGGTALPTHLASVTVEGTILGTLQYMAPEQLEGREADARTDIFALGAMLYEMLTGRKAFAGASQASLISAILRDDPPPLTALQPLAPAPLDHIVRTCLAKDPDERWQSAADVARELRWIGGGQGSATAASSSVVLRPTSGAHPADAIQPAAPAPVIRAHSTLGLAGAFVAGAALTALAMWTMTGRSEPAVATPVHARIDLAPAEVLSGGETTEVRSGYGRPSRTALGFSPDGRQLVFVGSRGGRQQLLVRVLDRDEATPLDGTEGAESPFFSPDGRQVGFWSNGALRRIPVGGGQPVEIVATPRPFGASWGDGDVVVYESGGVLMRVAAAGGPAEQIAPGAGDNGQLSYRLPSLLPGGRGVLFTDISEGFASARVAVWSFRTGSATTLIENAADGRYVGTGHLVFMRAGTLMAVPFDLDRLAVTGEVGGVIGDVMQAYNLANAGIHTMAGQYSVSANGHLAYIGGGVTLDSKSQLVWLDRTGRPEPLPMEPASYLYARLSPEGRRIAARRSVVFRSAIVVYDIERQQLTQLPYDGDANRPLWTPDGRDIVFVGGDTISRMRADGTGEVQRLTTGFGPAGWGPEGELIFARANDILALQPDGQVRPLVATPAAETHPALSPDGRWLAYASNQSGRAEVYVQPYPSLEGRHTVSVAGGDSPAWSRHGREIIYRQAVSADEGRFIAVEFHPNAAVPVGAWKELFRKSVRDLLYATPLRGFDVTPDGTRLLGVMTLERPTSPPPAHINLILNWFEELRRR